MPDDIVYLNGRYLPKAQATLSVEDRGTLFGDGVYEVVRYYNGQPFAMAEHLARLKRSLAGIELAEPGDVPTLPAVSDELVRRNGSPDARVYWQITRGSAPRSHAFPQGVAPTVLVMTYPAAPLDRDAPVACWSAIALPDQRWGRCSIKSLMLLPNVLAREHARQQGCQEAILYRGESVTEGSAANVFAVCDGQLRTHPGDEHILGGVTRECVLRLAVALGIDVVERAVTLAELHAAEEVFFTGTTTLIAAATSIDGQRIGQGEPGDITARLYQALVQHIAEECG